MELYTSSGKSFIGKIKSDTYIDELRYISKWINMYVTVWLYVQRLALPETNVAPENRVSQKETHLLTIHFQGLC